MLSANLSYLRFELVQIKIKHFRVLQPWIIMNLQVRDQSVNPVLFEGEGE